MIWTDPTFTPDPRLTIPLFDTPSGPYLISHKQHEIMRLCREKTGKRKLIFTASEKWTGKTLGCLDAVCDHAFNTKDSHACILVTTIGAGSDSGVWTKLVGEIIPAWIDGNFGFDWWMGGKRPVRGERMRGASKKLYVELTNKFGGKSYIELGSLQQERDVEALFFNRYFDFIYWCELQNFKDRKTFDTLTQSLRRPSVPEEDHVLLADGNPSEQGKAAWQYKLWFEFRTDPKVPEEQKPLQENLKLVRLTLDDNPFLSTRRKQEIKASYAHDPNLYARYVKGEWVEASTDSLFVDVFSEAKHVVGDNDPDPDILVPSDDVLELYNGWDFGLVNPAVVFCEQAFPDEWRDKQSKANGDINPDSDISQFRFFDEICYLDAQELSLWDFVHLVLERRREWEKVIGHPVKWIDIGDRSVFDTKCPESDRLQHAEILAASGGEINIIGVDRGPGTLSAGIRLWRRLLFAGRLLFSREGTPNLIAAQTGLAKARGPTGPIPYSVAKGSRHKHPFDAGRYLVVKLCWHELLDLINEAQTKKKSELKVINVKM